MPFAEGGCVADYDLDIVTNYKDVLVCQEPPRKAQQLLAGSYPWPLASPTIPRKQASLPPSRICSVLSSGRIALPSFDWFGPHLYAVNGALGGSNDTGSRHAFIAELSRTMVPSC